MDLLTILPPRVSPGGLPVSLLLHGLNGCARYAGVGGLSEFLAELVAAGEVPPFAFVAVDGGNTYWHDRNPGDDAMGMLLDEVPGWLAERGLGGAQGEPFACTGVSMGGFGALLYARRRLERNRPAAAVAAISPGLVTSWQDMSSRGVFDREEDWHAVNPLYHVEKLGSVPTGVWIGDKDRFLEGTRRFMADATLSVASVTPGGHTSSYYRSVMPEVIRFVGKHVPSAVR